MKPLVTISFGKSSSGHFGHAVDLAASLPGYRQQGQGQQVIHLVEFEVSLGDDSWDKLERLLQLIAAWRSASIAVDGRIMQSSEIPPECGPDQAVLWPKAPACRGRSTTVPARRHRPLRPAVSVVACVVAYHEAVRVVSWRRQPWTEWGSLSDQARCLPCRQGGDRPGSAPRGARAGLRPVSCLHLRACPR